MAEASAPGSAGNLGPGFDSLALALEIRCRVRAEPAGDWRVTHRGPYAPGPDDDDAVLAAARRAVGAGHPLHMEVFNDIPLTRGLGSSAAALTAGAAAALRAAGRSVDPLDLVALVTAFEGHADNAGASVYGGLVAALPDGRVRNLVLHKSLVPVVAVPDDHLPTKVARDVLPEAVPFPVAARTLSRAIALVEGLRTADPDLLAAAAGDELHERPRSVLHPRAEALIGIALSAGALHACWSGAGPSILALATRSNRAALVETWSSQPGISIITPDVALRGLE